MGQELLRDFEVEKQVCETTLYFRMGKCNSRYRDRTRKLVIAHLYNFHQVRQAVLDRRTIGRCRLHSSFVVA